MRVLVSTCECGACECVHVCLGRCVCELRAWLCPRYRSPYFWRHGLSVACGLQIRLGCWPASPGDCPASDFPALGYRYPTWLSKIVGSSDRSLVLMLVHFLPWTTPLALEDIVFKWAAGLQEVLRSKMQFSLNKLFSVFLNQPCQICVCQQLWWKFCR